MSSATLKKYETVVVARHDAGHDALAKLHQKVNDLMEKEGARAIRFEFWGKRKLAYPIAKATKGIYLYHSYLAEGDFVRKLTRALQVSPIVLRYLTVKLADGIDPEAYDFEREQHFDALPAESEEIREHAPTTGWSAEVAGAGVSEAEDEDSEDEDSEDEDSEGEDVAEEDDEEE